MNGKKRKQTTQGRDGRTASRHHTGISPPGHRQRGVSYHFLPATLVLLEMFKMQFIGPTIGSEEIFLASLLIVGIRSRC